MYRTFYVNHLYSIIITAIMLGINFFIGATRGWHPGEHIDRRDLNLSLLHCSVCIPSVVSLSFVQAACG
jgi:hypothetical protein